jgi:hypothetical protein
MRSHSLSAALAAGVIGVLGAGAAEVSAEPLRDSVSKQAALLGIASEDISRLSPAALLQAALVVSEGDGSSTKREQLARILQQQ